jgi:hypothetical protein
LSGLKKLIQDGRTPGKKFEEEFFLPELDTLTAEFPGTDLRVNPASFGYLEKN